MIISALLGTAAVAALGGGGLLTAFTLRKVVPTNEVHIIQTRNKTISYGKGRETGNVYYKWPSFLPMIGISVTKYSGAIFDVSLKEYIAYDIGRLPFTVDVMAFFRIDNSDQAAERVSNIDELQTQLVSVVQGAVRSILAQYDIEKIMSDRSIFGHAFTEEVDKNLKEWGVSTVKSIELMDIKDYQDNNVIKNITAKDKSRIERESRETVAENMRAAQEKEIEAKRQVELQALEATQQVGKRTAETEQQVGLSKETAKQAILEQAKETAQRDMAVKLVTEVRNAEIARDVAKVKAEQDKNVAIVKAQAQKETDTLVADGKLAATERDAQGTKVLGEAVAAAETAKLMAPVNAQTALAKEIGGNEGYQKYLITIEQIKVGGEVGKAQAQTLSNADIKIIANAGDPTAGLNSIGAMFTPQGGLNIAGALTALAGTDEGKALVDKITGK